MGQSGGTPPYVVQWASSINISTCQYNIDIMIIISSEWPCSPHGIADKQQLIYNYFPIFECSIHMKMSIFVRDYD
jgi:hypothetical protein